MKILTSLFLVIGFFVINQQKYRVIQTQYINSNITGISGTTSYKIKVPKPFKKQEEPKKILAIKEE